MRLRIHSVFSVLLAACATPTAPANTLFTAHAAAGSLQLQNASPTPVYYFAVEQTTAALIDWAPCTDPAGSCPKVVGGTRLDVPYSGIPGYKTGSLAAVVYWWHLVPSPGNGFQVDSIRTVVVRL